MAPTTLALNRMEFSTGAPSSVKTFFRKLGDKLLLVPKNPKEDYPKEFTHRLERLKDSAEELKRIAIMYSEIATLDYRGKEFDPTRMCFDGNTTWEVTDPDRSIPKRIAFAIGARVLAFIPSMYFLFAPQLLGIMTVPLVSLGLGINKLRQLRTELKIAKVEEQADSK